MWSDDKASGHGTLEYSNGDLYDGHWENDQRNGNNHTYTHTHTHTHTHTYIHTYTNAHTHTHRDIHTHIHTQMHTHAHTYTSIHTHAHTTHCTQTRIHLTYLLWRHELPPSSLILRHLTPMRFTIFVILLATTTGIKQQHQ